MTSAPAAHAMTQEKPVASVPGQHPAANPPPATSSDTPPKVEVQDLNVYFRRNHAIRHVSLKVQPRTVMAVIGPSGCGKSTFVRALNRMHDLVPGARVEGKVYVDGKDLYSKTVDPVLLRRRVGMVFQRPNPFPTMSIYDNVVAGYNLNGARLARVERDRIVEETLRRVTLWDEVKDSLYRRGTFLSGGQQQRLCIARALAMKPEIVLLDEPTSALDPKATAAIEELIVSLKGVVTIVQVTHNIPQAARISDYTAFIHLGELVEYGPTKTLFTVPRDKRTEEYLSGKFG